MFTGYFILSLASLFAPHLKEVIDSDLLQGVWFKQSQVVVAKFLPRTEGPIVYKTIAFEKKLCRTASLLPGDVSDSLEFTYKLDCSTQPYRIYGIGDENVIVLYAFYSIDSDGNLHITRPLNFKPGDFNKLRSDDLDKIEKLVVVLKKRK
jgi:hypothetical protein